jgi:hypothetical protein
MILLVANFTPPLAGFGVTNIYLEIFNSAPYKRTLAISLIFAIDWYLSPEINFGLKA